METALLAMMGALLAMMAGLFLKLVDLGARMGRVETKVDTALLFCGSIPMTEPLDKR